jgi:isopenicillin N synthase-like dioxygenase
MDAELALRMNEHNNGYMMLGRYAVWTSDVNANDKPDLNEAFFVKRERGRDDPLVLAKRRFAGPNQWPADLPGFRETVLTYTDTVDALGRKLMPLCATALDLPPDTFDKAFAESQFSFRLTHYPPVAAEANQFGIAPHTDANFMTFLAQTEVPGLQVRMPDGTWVDVPYVPGFLTRINIPSVAAFAFWAQQQIATFFATEGAVVIDPDGLGPFFEVPIAGPLPEMLNFIP